MLLCATLNHAVFFVFCLYFVGFKSTMTNMILFGMAYSNQLTLRLRMIACYFCALAVASVHELFYDLATKESIQQIGLIVNVCFYGINVFFVGKAFWAFRQTGGLRGDPTAPEYSKDNILPKFLVSAGEVGWAGAKNLGAKADKKMDAIIEKDKEEDRAAAEFNK